jgi:hypothetical protein
MFYSHIKKKRGKGITLSHSFGTLEIGISGVVNFNRDSTISKNFFDLVTKKIREAHSLETFNKKIPVYFVESFLKIQL